MMRVAIAAFVFLCFAGDLGRMEFVAEEPNDLQQEEKPLPPPSSKPQGLRIVVVTKPEKCAQVAEENDTVRFHYTGRAWDENGHIFDCSRIPRSSDREEGWPFITKLEGKLTPGLEQGVMGMCVGEVRHLYVASELAFGKAGISAMQGRVGPDEPVFYDVEMIEITKYDPEEEQRKVIKQGRTWEEHFESMDVNNDEKVSKLEYLNNFIKENVDEELFRDDPDERKRVRKEVVQFVRDIFRVEDLDGDGFITRREFAQKLQDGMDRMGFPSVQASSNLTSEKDEL